MNEGDPFFVERGGVVWVCWLDGKPAVRLAETGVVLAAMADFRKDAEEAMPPEKEVSSQSVTRTLGKDDLGSETAEKDDVTRPHMSRERIEDRHPVSARGTIRTARHRRDVILCDLSTRGCRFLEKSRSLKRGTFLTIKIGPVGPLDAEIMWNQGDVVGVQFVEPLHSSVFEHICQHSSSGGGV